MWTLTEMWPDNLYLYLFMLNFLLHNYWKCSTFIAEIILPAISNKEGHTKFHMKGNAMFHVFQLGHMF